MANSTTNVGVVFTAVNNMTAGINGVARDINRLQSTFTAITRAGAAVGGLYGVTQALGSWITAAKEAEKINRVFQVSMAGSAEGAVQWADSWSKSAGVCDLDVKKLLGSFNLLAEELGAGPREALKMSESLTKLSYDISSFTKLKPEEAAQTLLMAMQGSTRALKQLGISISDVTIKDYALQQGWIKEGQELSALQKTYATYNLILDHSEKMHGALASAAGTAADEERRLKEEWEDTKILLGQDLMPAYKAGVSVLHDFAKGLGAIVEAAQKIGPALKAAAETARDIGRSGVLSTTFGGVSGTGNTFRSGQPFGIDVGQPERRSLLDGLNPDDEMVDPATVNRWRMMFEDARRDNATMRKAEYEALQNPGGEDASKVDKKLADDAERFARERERIYTRMYKDLKGMNQEAFAFGVELLNAEWERYEKYVTDKNTLNRWYQQQYRQLEIERMEAGDDWFAGFSAGTMKMQDELKTLGQLGAESAEQMRDAWVEGTMDMIFESKSLGAVLRSIALDFAKMQMRQGLNQIYTQGMGAIGSGLGSLFGGQGGGAAYGSLYTGSSANYGAMQSFYGYHSGGLVGQDASFVRSLPASYLRGAPRFHQGLGAGEFPAILQAGERVIPRSGGSAAKFELHVHDESGQGLDIEGGDIHQETGRVVMEIFAKDRRRRGPLTRGGY